MAYTNHASIRCRQRAIPRLVVDLLLQFGVRTPAGDGTEKVSFDKRARRNVRTYAGPLASSIESHLDVYAVVCENTIVTVAHRLERIQSH